MLFSALFLFQTVGVENGKVESSSVELVNSTTHQTLESCKMNGSVTPVSDSDSAWEQAFRLDEIKANRALVEAKTEKEKAEATRQIEIAQNCIQILSMRNLTTDDTKPVPSDKKPPV